MDHSEHFTSADYASDLIRFPELNSLHLEPVASASRKGVLIGNMITMPYFLDPDAAVNPHIFICGVTGSGKTYLMRSLMLRLDLLLGAKIVLIDFTGEYAEFVEITGSARADPDLYPELLTNAGTQLIYLCFKEEANEASKINAAERALLQTLEVMRKSVIGGRKTFVFLDEAWKLLGNSKALHTLLREGRKYGYGLVFSSQLVEDIDLSILSNAATLFMFRLQNKQGLSKLAANYKLKSEQIAIVQALGVGSCTVIQTRTSGKRDFCVIQRVHGIEVERWLTLKIGVNMQFKIARKEFEKEIESLCGVGSARQALQEAEKKGYLDLSELTAILISKGADNERVLSSLRKIGIDDDSIADSFATAIATLANK